MSRVIRVVLGAGLIGYGIYSGNTWFYLGVVLLVIGLYNWCPIESMLGGCKNGSCSSSSCNTVSKETKSSCCSTPEEQITKFTTTVLKSESCCQDTSENIVIKILGIGCANCIALKKIAEEAIEEIGVEAEIIKVEDANEIMNYKVMSTPGLVVNEEVKSIGKLLSKEEMIALINGASEQKSEAIKSKCCS